MQETFATSFSCGQELRDMDAGGDSKDLEEEGSTKESDLPDGLLEDIEGSEEQKTQGAVAADKLPAVDKDESRKTENVSELRAKKVDGGTDTVSAQKVDDESGSQDSRSHNDVIQKAEQRRDASDIVKAAVRQESERQKEIPAWENESENQIDPRNRVGEEATKIMNEKKQSDEEVIDQIGAFEEEPHEVEPKMGVNEDSKQDKQHKDRLESQEKAQERAKQETGEKEQHAKTTKYDSIDPLADQEGMGSEPS